jgi:hypothetical protein
MTREEKGWCALTLRADRGAREGGAGGKAAKGDVKGSQADGLLSGANGYTRAEQEG